MMWEHAIQNTPPKFHMFLYSVEVRAVAEVVDAKVLVEHSD